MKKELPRVYLILLLTQLFFWGFFYLFMQNFS